MVVRAGQRGVPGDGDGTGDRFAGSSGTGEQARRTVVEFYSADRMASDYERLYLKIARPQGTSIRSDRYLAKSA
jgi:hypothetical protein